MKIVRGWGVTLTKEKESKKSKSSRSGEKKSTTRKQKSKQEGRFRNGRNYGLKYWSKIWPTYKYSAIIVTILVIVPTSILFTYPSLFVNPNEQFETPYSYQIGNEYGTNESLFISGSGAVVSSLSVQIDYWFNWSQFYDASTLWFLYYSGEHDDYYNASEEISIGSTNYINWWTFSTYIGKPDFSTSSIDTTYEEIPPHDAETKVTFQFLMEEWNGTQWTFKEWNGTYTVLYNHNEIEYEHNLYQTFWFYLSVGLYFIAATVVVVRPFKINDKKESMDDEKSPDEVKPKPFDPTVEYLASRCNQLDKNRSNFRTGVGIKEILGEKKVTGVVLDNSEKLEADAVVLSMGYHPNQLDSVLSSCQLITSQSSFLDFSLV